MSQESESSKEWSADVLRGLTTAISNDMREAAKTASQAARQALLDEFKRLYSDVDLYAVRMKDYGEYVDIGCLRAVTATYAQALEYVEKVECYHYVSEADQPTVYREIEKAKSKRPRAKHPVVINWKTKDHFPGYHHWYLIESISYQETLETLLFMERAKKKEEEVRSSVPVCYEG
ncbi:MAG TPA: hypothetical protein VMQ44_02945 [Candidatus Saccharimonadales bacterium]|nr:hypothetical protein [Candidatus Saccharimonadales bacterium]